MLDPLPILHALGVTEPVAMIPVSGGWDTSFWRVELGARKYALRVFRPEQVEVWRREAAVLRLCTMPVCPYRNCRGQLLRTVLRGCFLPGVTVELYLTSCRYGPGKCGALPLRWVACSHAYMQCP